MVSGNRVIAVSSRLPCCMGSHVFNSTTRQGFPHLTRVPRPKQPKFVFGICKLGFVLSMHTQAHSNRLRTALLYNEG